MATSWPCPANASATGRSRTSPTRSTTRSGEAIEERVLLAYEAATGNRAISRIERGEATVVRADLLGVEEFGFVAKNNP